MCGFSGFVHYGEAKLDKEKRLRILKAMGAAIAHRGPDDEQIYDDGVLSLVYRRLSIVDIAGGRQPFLNEDKSQLLVCNGEIYNHGEMRRALSAGHRFTTASDCEVLLHGYAQWGEDVLQRARGMFAMALWDRTQRRLLLARDRLGIKPLYVCQLPHGLLFGSELKALLAHPDCPREMDWQDLGGNPIAHAATPSYIRGIEHLPGACCLHMEPGKKAHIRSYWNLEQHFNTAPFGLDAKRYIAEFDRLIEDAVAEHMQGEAGFGLHLSGGVDSSLVAAIAAPHQPGMHSFTLVERSNYVAGDASAASNVAATLGLPWNPVLVDYRKILQDTDFSLQTLEQSAWTMDSPLFDIEWILKRELNQLIRSRHPDLKVLLLGQGADEFSGGYSSRIDAPYAHWNAYVQEEVQHFLSVGSSGDEGRGGRHSVFLGKRKLPSGISPYQQMMTLMPRQLQHHNLWHEDRTSASVGMEARVPFLDHRIVEFFASVPVALHKKLFWNKYIIRQALRKRLPSYDIARPKIGFCWTDDSRSLDIIIQNMALQASGAFRDKYMDAKDFPFKREETERLIQQVRTRQPGFQGASVQLLGQMSATIFRHHAQHTAAAIAANASRQEASGLEIVTDARWPEVVQHFAKQPIEPFDWQADHCPQVPADCAIQRSGETGGQDHYQLVQGSTVHAELRFPSDSHWIKNLMTGLDDPANGRFSVRDWMEQLQVSRAQITEVLDALLQCGMVSTPQRRSRLGYWARVRLYMRKRFLHARQRPPAPADAPLAQWMERLKQRQQALESELRK